MHRKISTILKWIICLAFILGLLAVADYLIFGGSYTGMTYSLWAWQAHWKWAFWAPVIIFCCGLGPAIYFWRKSVALKWRGKHSESAGAWVAGWIGIIIVVVFSLISLIALLYLQDGSRQMALLKQAKVQRISEPVAIQDQRRLPFVVAKTAANLRYNRPNYHLTDAHLVRSCSGEWMWSMIQTPKRNWLRSTGGIVQISAQSAAAGAREVKVVTQSFKYGPGMRVRDSLTYQIRKQLGRDIDVPETVGFIDCAGQPRLLSPVMKWNNAGSTRFKSQAGVAVTRPDGNIKYYSLAAAQANPGLVKTGRLIASQQATAAAESYRYINGRQNQSGGLLGFINKGDQQGRYEVLKTSDKNTQPYLLQGADGQAYWVTMLRPYRSGKALGGIMYTNSVSGISKLWLAPVDKSGVGTSSVIGPDAAMGFTDIQTPYINTARLQSTEPRLFLSSEGKLSYIVNLATSDSRRVVAAVAVDSLTGDPLALFNYQRDSNAEQKLKEYLANGKIPDGTSLQGDAGTGITPSQPEDGPGSKSKNMPQLTSSPLTPSQLSALLAACQKDKICRQQLLK